MAFVEWKRNGEEGSIAEIILNRPGSKKCI
jgi:hypothetical protein